MKSYGCVGGNHTQTDSLESGFGVWVGLTLGRRIRLLMRGQYPTLGAIKIELWVSSIAATLLPGTPCIPIADNHNPSMLHAAYTYPSCPVQRTRQLIQSMLLSVLPGAGSRSLGDFDCWHVRLNTAKLSLLSDFR